MKNLLLIAFVFCTVFSMTAQVNYNGLPHSPLGEASLKLKNGQLLVTNMGDSGEDGVSIKMNQCTSFGIAHEPVNIPEGGSMNYSFNSANGNVSQINLTNVGNDQKEFSAFFRSGETVVVEGFLKGRKVYEDRMSVIGDGNSNSRYWIWVALYVLDHLDAHADVSHTTNSDGSSSTTYSGGVSWNGVAPPGGGSGSGSDPAEVTLYNGATILVDLLKVSATTAEYIESDFTTVNITGRNIDQFVVTDEYTDCEEGTDAGSLFAGSGNTLQSLGNTHIKVHPNPFSTNAQVDFQLEKATAVDIEIYDMAGQKVSSLAEGQNYSAGRHSLNLEKDLLPEGIYIIKMKADNRVHTTKMMIAD